MVDYLINSVTCRYLICVRHFSWVLNNFFRFNVSFYFLDTNKLLFFVRQCFSSTESLILIYPQCMNSSSTWPVCCVSAFIIYTVDIITNKSVYCAVLWPLHVYQQKHPLNFIFLGLFTASMSLTVGVSCANTEG